MASQWRRGSGRMQPRDAHISSAQRASSPTSLITLQIRPDSEPAAAPTLPQSQRPRRLDRLRPRSARTPGREGQRRLRTRLVCGHQAVCVSSWAASRHPIRRSVPSSSRASARAASRDPSWRTANVRAANLAAPPSWLRRQLAPGRHRDARSSGFQPAMRNFRRFSFSFYRAPKYNKTRHFAPYI